MRIASGILKGRQLLSPKGSHVRPTTDKLRSAIFSILSSMDNYSNILDGFAGTGALGIEAFSRGASYIDFIDKDTYSLKENCKMLNKGSFSIIKGDFLKVSEKLGKKYDIIFLDPPYNVYKTLDILEKVHTCSILKDTGIIIFEEFYKTEFNCPSVFTVYDERRYGDTVIRFLKYI